MKQIKNKKIRVEGNEKRKLIGMAPFDGYNDIKKEELKLLKDMSMDDARIQTEALLRAAKWMR